MSTAASSRRGSVFSWLAALALTVKTREQLDAEEDALAAEPAVQKA